MLTATRALVRSRIWPSNFLPCLVRVADLQRCLLDEANSEVFAKAFNWIEAFLLITLGNDSEVHAMLRQAMMARRAVLLLDGLG